MAELATDHGADLRDLLDRREAVEARHQQVVQGRRDRERRQGAGQLVAIAGVREQARFQHRLGQLLDEQRHAVGARHDLLDDLGRQRLVAGDPRDRSAPWRRPSRPMRQRRHVRLAGPGRGELRPEGDQRQRRQLPDALDHHAQELEGRGVDPVHVLVQRQHRLLRRERRELVEQRLQGPPLLHLRRQGQRRIALAGRHTQQRGEQRHHFVQPLARPPSTSRASPAAPPATSSRSSRAARSSSRSPDRARCWCDAASSSG